MTQYLRKNVYKSYEAMKNIYPTKGVVTFEIEYFQAW